MFDACAWFVDHLNQLAIGFGSLIFLAVWVRLLILKREVTIDEIIIKRVFPAFSLPTGIALVMCGLFNNLASKLSDSGIYLALAGMVVIFTAVQSISSKLPPKGGGRL